MAHLPILKFIFDRHKRASSKKHGSIELQITFHRQVKFMATGIRILPREWKNGQVINRLDALELNAALDILMANARSIVTELLAAGQLELSEIPKRMKATQEPQEMKPQKNAFIEYCKERARVRMYGKTKDSQERYNRFMRFFTAWGVITQFDDITEANIVAMDKVLASKKLKDNSKWNNYHRFLNSFIIDAVADGLVRRNPYRHVRINRDKESRSLWKHLTLEEFHKIEQVKLPTECLRQVRDVFVFQVYTCLAYVDLAAFDFTKVKKDKGRLVYSGTRGKTGQEFSFMLMKPAQQILDRYDGVLPLVTNQKYNDYLKALAQHAGIDKPLTSHWARHTGATLLLNTGVDMEVVAKILGHSSSKITREVYAKLLDDTVYKAMEMAEKKMKGDYRGQSRGQWEK